MTARFSMNGDGRKSSQNRLSRVGISKTHPDPNNQEFTLIEALKERYAELEDVWDEAEKELKRFRVHHAVEHAYNGRNFVPNDPGSPYGCEYLGWVRYGSAWRICHCFYCDESPEHENWNWKPVVDCAVDIRVQAVNQFPELRRRVVTAAEECVPTLDKAIADLRKALER